jgi:hypothetical protein
MYGIQSLNSTLQFITTLDDINFLKLFEITVKNHDRSMYLKVGKNPKYEIVRHLSGIWDLKEKERLVWIKKQTNDVIVKLQFNVGSFNKKKSLANFSENHFLIDLKKIDQNMDLASAVLTLSLHSTFQKHTDYQEIITFPSFKNFSESYLYLKSESCFLAPSLPNDCDINVFGDLIDCEDDNLKKIQKEATLSLSAGKWFLIKGDKKNYRLLFVHSVDMRTNPQLIARCECGHEIRGKAVDKTYMTQFDVPNDKVIRSIELNAEL